MYHPIQSTNSNIVPPNKCKNKKSPGLLRNDDSYRVRRMKGDSNSRHLQHRTLANMEKHMKDEAQARPTEIEEIAKQSPNLATDENLSEVEIQLEDCNNSKMNCKCCESNH